MDSIKRAEALLQQAGYKKFDTWEEYHDFEKWLTNEDQVIISLTSSNLAYSVTYCTSLGDVDPPMKHLETDISGKLFDLSPEIVASIEAGFNRDEVLAKGTN